MSLVERSADDQSFVVLLYDQETFNLCSYLIPKYLAFKGQELPRNDYWTRFVKKEDTSKKDKTYLASVMRSIPLEMFGPAE